MFEKLSGLVSYLFSAKTQIFNWLVLVTATLTLWLDSEVIQQYPEITAALGAVVAAVNAVSRALAKIPGSGK